ncbi:MAG TPA: M23 family metallopeptidase [Nocardioides sp.]|jgi:murein DD-endopeptidase MepM/ murein hydrolase activator NlpD|uniref:murein hydrolase activator EnvC family protein n=1 Tax=Nocardioides sp. TaxID=35761 RepID=UPI002E31316D|nr:M23 family metallopeptidase [Nocardioides sp.]HEX3931022.1 M23 family metallopeptidase [Nocardioides sp.]
MNIPLPRRIRAHGRRSLLVVAVVLVAGLGPPQPAGAASPPVGPVPSGVWPLEPTPQVVRRFDPPDAPWGAGHRGVDLAGTVGEVVRAGLAGRIAFAGSLAGRGVVVVDHGDTRTTYEPVLAQVRVGDTVALGQPIGRLELVDSHCFPAACLHWGWKRGTRYLDPLLLVGGGPIVLLPLAGAATVVALPPARPLPPRAPIEPATSRGGTAPVWRRPLAMRPLLW